MKQDSGSIEARQKSKTKAGNLGQGCEKLSDGGSVLFGCNYRSLILTHPLRTEHTPCLISSTDHDSTSASSHQIAARRS